MQTLAYKTMLLSKWIASKGLKNTRNTFRQEDSISRGYHKQPLWEYKSSLLTWDVDTKVYFTFSDGKNNTCLIAYLSKTKHIKLKRKKLKSLDIITDKCWSVSFWSILPVYVSWALLYIKKCTIFYINTAAQVFPPAYYKYLIIYSLSDDIIFHLTLPFFGLLTLFPGFSFYFKLMLL